MVFVALKPCRFGGTDYLIGDTIPGDAVLPTRAKALQQMGIIAIGFEQVTQQLNDVIEDAKGEGSDADGNETPAEGVSEDNPADDSPKEEHKPKRGRHKAE